MKIDHACRNLSLATKDYTHPGKIRYILSTKVEKESNQEISPAD